MKIHYSQRAKERLRHLPPDIKRGIRTEIEKLHADAHSGKPLGLELTGLWRMAFKRYRIIYETSPDFKTVNIITVGHRTSIYQELSKE